MCCLVVLETLLWGDECMCALQQSVGKAPVEVNTASSPYINHHMSSSLNKMYSSLFSLDTERQQISVVFVS